MKKENIFANVNQAESDQAAGVEDLTVAEADTEQIKGGTTSSKDPAFVNLQYYPWTVR